MPSSATVTARLGASPPGPVTWLLPAVGTEIARDAPNVLRAQDGFITIHGFAGTTRGGCAVTSGEPCATPLRFVAAALVDLRPVEAQWTIYGPDRASVDEVVTGSGFARSRKRPVAFTVKIPIPREGAHEVETYVELAPLQSRDTSDADVRRFVVAHAPGAKTPVFACERVQPVAPTDAEAALRREGLSQSLAYRTDGGEYRVAVESSGPGAYAAVPLIDGRPAGAAVVLQVGDGTGIVHRASWKTRPPGEDREGPEIGFVAPVWRDAFRTGETAAWTSNFTATNFVFGVRDEARQRLE